MGSVRIGISRSDTSGALAIPLDTVSRVHGGADVAKIASLAREYDAIEVAVGLPVHLSGEEGKSAAAARSFARLLQKRLPEVRICLVDERLSSTQAHARLQEAGLPGRKQRPVVDQVAAQVILEQALSMERSTGHPPGEPILPERGERTISE